MSRARNHAGFLRRVLFATLAVTVLWTSPALAAGDPLADVNRELSADKNLRTGYRRVERFVKRKMPKAVYKRLQEIKAERVDVTGPIFALSPEDRVRKARLIAEECALRTKDVKSKYWIDLEESVIKRAMKKGSASAKSKKLWLKARRLGLASVAAFVSLLADQGVALADAVADPGSTAGKIYRAVAANDCNTLISMAQRPGATKAQLHLEFQKAGMKTGANIALTKRALDILQAAADNCKLQQCSTCEDPSLEFGEEGEFISADEEYANEEYANEEYADEARRGEAGAGFGFELEGLGRYTGDDERDYRKHINRDEDRTDPPAHDPLFELLAEYPVDFETGVIHQVFSAALFNECHAAEGLTRRPARTIRRVARQLRTGAGLVAESNSENTFLDAGAAYTAVVGAMTYLSSVAEECDQPCELPSVYGTFGSERH